MKPVFTFLLITVAFRLAAQNLVSNGSFEQFTMCPTYVSQLTVTGTWFPPSLGTSDYFNQCAAPASKVDVPQNVYGYRPARTGTGYAGIALFWTGDTDHREYLEVQLTTTLVAGQCYHFEMHMSASDSCKYITPNIGAYFSSSMLYSLTPSSFIITPHISNGLSNNPDTLNWTLVSGDYVATGGETYLTIGNFLDTQSTVVTYTDNVLPYPGAYVYIDDVSLVPCIYTGLEDQQESQSGIYPNPLKDILNVELNDHEVAEVCVYDIAGQVVIRREFSHRTELRTASLEKGMYFYNITRHGAMLKQGKLMKE
jgi:hypothetical protein